MRNWKKEIKSKKETKRKKATKKYHSRYHDNVITFFEQKYKSNKYTRTNKYQTKEKDFRDLQNFSQFVSTSNHLGLFLFRKMKTEIK